MLRCGPAVARPPQLVLADLMPDIRHYVRKSGVCIIMIKNVWSAPVDVRLMPYQPRGMIRKNVRLTYEPLPQHTLNKNSWVYG